MLVITKGKNRSLTNLIFYDILCSAVEKCSLRRLIFVDRVKRFLKVLKNKREIRSPRKGKLHASGGRKTRRTSSNFWGKIVLGSRLPKGLIFGQPAFLFIQPIFARGGSEKMGFQDRPREKGISIINWRANRFVKIVSIFVIGTFLFQQTAWAGDLNTGDPRQVEVGPLKIDGISLDKLGELENHQKTIDEKNALEDSMEKVVEIEGSNIHRETVKKPAPPKKPQPEYLSQPEHLSSVNCYAEAENRPQEGKDMGEAIRGVLRKYAGKRKQALLEGGNRQQEIRRINKEMMEELRRLWAGDEGDSSDSNNNVPPDENGLPEDPSESEPIDVIVEIPELELPDPVINPLEPELIEEIPVIQIDEPVLDPTETPDNTEIINVAPTDYVDRSQWFDNPDGTVHTLGGNEYLDYSVDFGDGNRNVVLTLSAKNKEGLGSIPRTYRNFEIEVYVDDISKGILLVRASTTEYHEGSLELGSIQGEHIIRIQWLNDFYNPKRNQDVNIAIKDIKFEIEKETNITNNPDPGPDTSPFIVPPDPPDPAEDGSIYNEPDDDSDNPEEDNSDPVDPLNPVPPLDPVNDEPVIIEELIERDMHEHIAYDNYEIINVKPADTIERSGEWQGDNSVWAFTVGEYLKYGNINFGEGNKAVEVSLTAQNIGALPGAPTYFVIKVFIDDNYKGNVRILAIHDPEPNDAPLTVGSLTLPNIEGGKHTVKLEWYQDGFGDANIAITSIKFRVEPLGSEPELPLIPDAPNVPSPPEIQPVVDPIVTPSDPEDDLLRWLREVYAPQHPEIRIPTDRSSWDRLNGIEQDYFRSLYANALMPQKLSIDQICNQLIQELGSSGRYPEYSSQDVLDKQNQFKNVLNEYFNTLSTGNASSIDSARSRLIKETIHTRLAYDYRMIVDSNDPTLYPWRMINDQGYKTEVLEEIEEGVNRLTGIYNDYINKTNNHVNAVNSGDQRQIITTNSAREHAEIMLESAITGFKRIVGIYEADAILPTPPNYIPPNPQVGGGGAGGGGGSGSGSGGSGGSGSGGSGGGSGDGGGDPPLTIINNDTNTQPGLIDTIDAHNAEINRLKNALREAQLAGNSALARQLSDELYRLINSGPVQPGLVPPYQNPDGIVSYYQNPTGFGVAPTYVPPTGLVLPAQPGTDAWTATQAIYLGAYAYDASTRY